MTTYRHGRVRAELTPDNWGVKIWYPTATRERGVALPWNVAMDFAHALADALSERRD
ncbi:hypothetical protein [Mycolicibacterium fortuitum]